MHAWKCAHACTTRGGLQGCQSRRQHNCGGAHLQWPRSGLGHCTAPPPSLQVASPDPFPHGSRQHEAESTRSTSETAIDHVTFQGEDKQQMWRRRAAHTLHADPRGYKLHIEGATGAAPPLACTLAINHMDASTAHNHRTQRSEDAAPPRSSTALSVVPVPGASAGVAAVATPAGMAATGAATVATGAGAKPSAMRAYGVSMTHSSRATAHK